MFKPDEQRVKTVSPLGLEVDPVVNTFKETKGADSAVIGREPAGPRVTGPHLVLSALTGTLLLVLADLCAQQLPLFDNLPVGIYTMAVGGAHLGLLLVREWRRGVL